MEMLFPLCVGLTKISICCTYLQIFFSSRVHRVFCFSVITFLALHTTAWFFLVAFQCRPVVDYWINFDRTHCINVRAVLMATAACNNLTDLLVYLAPTRSLWRIQLPLRQRCNLVFIFTCGCMQVYGNPFFLVNGG